MDISNIIPGERIVEMKHPKTGDLLGIRVSLMSIADDRMKSIKRKIQDERLRLDARGKSFKADDVEDNRNKVTFGAMTGWEWYGQDEEKDASGKVIKAKIEQPTFNGKVPDFNRVTVLAVFEKLEWFRDQLDGYIDEEKAFFTD